MNKKKKKSSVNAIDKYLKQMKYRTVKKTEKKIRQPKVVISRIKSRRVQELIDAFKLEKNENKTFSIKVPVVKLIPAPKLHRVKPSGANFESEKNTRGQEAELANDVPSVTTKSCSVLTTCNFTKVAKRTGTAQPRSRRTDTARKKVTIPSCLEKNFKSKPIKKSEKNLLLKSASKNVNRKTKRQTVLTLTLPPELTNESVERPKKSVINKKNGRRCPSKSSQEAASSVETKKQTADILAKIQENEVPDAVTKRLINVEDYQDSFSNEERPFSKNRNFQTVSENQDEVLEPEPTSQPSQISNEPCLCEPINFDVDDFATPNSITRESLIPNKYRLSVEELKSLTAESISTFIKDNQQYYKDFKKPEPPKKSNTNTKKKRKEEFKDSFKCNPFDSAQQLAMYLTLREIFNIPAKSFSECRFFFTLLIPEICCQLFAKIFQIKSSLAPRLIKKFYPQPVCPV